MTKVNVHEILERDRQTVAAFRKIIPGTSLFELKQIRAEINVHVEETERRHAEQDRKSAEEIEAKRRAVESLVARRLIDRDLADALIGKKPTDAGHVFALMGISENAGGPLYYSLARRLFSRDGEDNGGAGLDEVACLVSMCERDGGCWLGLDEGTLLAYPAAAD